jgi:23S rRNA pseudouridine1911/1915/1917 synthase
VQEYLIIIQPQEAGKRLDLVLADFSLKNKLGLSRSSLQKLITGRQVQLGGRPLKAHYKVKPGDKFILQVSDNPTLEAQAEEIPLEVVYEDEDMAVINKPCGMVVHPAPGNYKHTLVNALLGRFRQLSDINPQRPGIVHRLDKDTSGLLVVAKNNAAHLSLAKQFAEHSIKRRYVALVRGAVEFNEDIIELPISRHPRRRKDMAVGFGEKARYAKTHYRTLKRGRDFSLLELEPFTGRTHQLRVHLAFLGHPILGDTKYGRDNAFTRLALHAMYLGFRHPRSGKFLEFTCSLPSEFH